MDRLHVTHAVMCAQDPTGGAAAPLHLCCNGEMDEGGTPGGALSLTGNCLALGAGGVL